MFSIQFKTVYPYLGSAPQSSENLQILHVLKVVVSRFNMLVKSNLATFKKRFISEMEVDLSQPSLQRYQHRLVGRLSLEKKRVIS